MSIFQIALLPLNIFLVTQAATAQTTPAQPNRVPSGDASAQTNPSTLEPKALNLLKAMSDRLASAQTLSFTAISSYESPSRLGPPLVYTTTSEVALQRPDKLRVITPGDGAASEFYYDGKQMVAYAPTENLVATAEAPATIDAALAAAYNSAAIYFPFTDLIVADPYSDLASRLTTAFYMGQSQVVGGITTDMIAIGNDKVFAQLWIGADDHLPRRMRAVYADDPLQLRHQMEFSNWQLNSAIAADAFTSSQAARAIQIPFTRPDPPSPASSSSAPNP
ncbi:MAG TPA: DUF2092 domain-containing protein [Allocoleopsis sp.]